MIRLLFALVLAGLLTSCDPCKRATRALALCPAMQVDTVVEVVEHTHIVPGQTLYVPLPIHDTITIDTGRIIVRYLPPVPGTTTATLNVACKPDTVYLPSTTKIIRERIPTRAPKANNTQAVLLSIAISLLATCLIVILIHKYFKK